MKVKVEVELSEEQMKQINAVLLDSEREKFCSHGKLDINSLVGMLLEDVALVIGRPGSWEGANMLTVLSSHGYRAAVFETRAHR